jgi:hypothetical protein
LASKTSALKRHFIAYSAGGTVDAASRPQGGVLFLAHTSLRSIHHSSISSAGGQVALAWANGTLVGSCYTSHHWTRNCFLHKFATQMITLPSVTTWFIAGDWNDTPEDTPFLDAMAGSEVWVTATNLPTRVSGDRRVGFLVGTKCPDNPRRLGDMHSDSNFTIAADIFFSDPPARAHRVKKTTSYCRPAGMSKEDFGLLLCDAWDFAYQPVSDASFLDGAYLALRQAIESTFRDAYLKARADMESIDVNSIHMPSSADKGGDVIIEPIPLYHTKTTPEESGFHLRCHRDTRARLQEHRKLKADVLPNSNKLSAIRVLEWKLLHSSHADMALPLWQQVALLDKGIGDICAK